MQAGQETIHLSPGVTTDQHKAPHHHKVQGLRFYVTNFSTGYFTIDTASEFWLYPCFLQTQLYLKRTQQDCSTQNSLISQTFFLALVCCSPYWEVPWPASLTHFFLPAPRLRQGRLKRTALIKPGPLNHFYFHCT